MKNRNPMQYDLFRIYVKNHDIPYWYFISIAGFFLLVRHFLYGYPSQEALICGIALLCVSGVFSFFQSSCYKEILKSEIRSKKSMNEAIMTVASNKVLYLVPWLIIMFSPIQSDVFYDHLLGYAFLFFMIAASASSSSAYLPLFLFDVFICLISGILILILNYDVQETLLTTLFLSAFSAYAIFLAWKINLSAVEVLKKGREYETIAQKAEQANRVKSDFLAFMSHEIRTPMSGILGMTRFLKETPLSEEQKEYINTISGCSETLLNTLNDAIDITKIESGKLKIIQKTFNLGDILKNSMLVVDPLAREKGLNTFIEIEESAAGLLHGDPFRVQQVVINLLNNAVKFTQQGSIAIHASVRHGPAPMIRISVTDTGIGITPEDQKKLFIQFSQIENDNSAHYKGFGLGLSISKNLVSLMEGAIGVASNPGGGTTFWFEIPYIPAPALQQDSLPDKKLVAKATVPMNILLVEDNRINMMIATRLLEARGHRLTTALTGAEAIEHVRKSLPDLILMDLNIPDGDGIEIARKIFMMGGEYAAIPVILVTANSSTSIVEKCESAGIRDCLLKPYAPEDLYFMIERYGRPGPAAPREPNQKLSALLEVFGPEYTKHFLKSSMEEVNLLLERIESAFQKGNLPAMAGHAHELIAVSGSLGLDSISDLARKTEATCMKDTGLKLAELLARMKAEIHQVSFEDLAAYSGDF